MPFETADDGGAGGRVDVVWAEIGELQASQSLIPQK